MSVLDEAIIFATRAHSGQFRKMSRVPYIVHPCEVAAILGTMTDDENVIAAGMLHDTVEDCDVDPIEIRERFGPRVYAIVMSETEDKLSTRSPEETWMERKQDSLIALALTKDIDVKRLWLADKLSNMRSFTREYLMHGDVFWKNLHQKDPKMHYWYYKSVAEAVPELADTFAYKELIEKIQIVFEKEINDDKS